MNAPGTAERTWRRRSLWLLPAVLALSLAWRNDDNVPQWLVNRELRPRDVPAQAQGALGGAQWKLLEFGIIDAPARRGWLPGSRASYAAFEVQVQADDLPRRWQACRIALHDARGRVWRPATEPVLRMAPHMARGCLAAAHRGVPPGSKLTIMEVFMLPPDVARPLTLSVSVGSERPAYLRFAVPAAD
ncbi:MULTISPECIES: hypothetical protein [Bordetella]|uniref:Uncharacterized protein n=2 Tax=Bordetella TaxID=517 RepID=K0MBR7_BORPB|nr:MULTISPECIES: hypothetical protein [Bordetella]KAK65145.1 hypothetical protein AZ22_1539 [Bordetella bronchiseptica 980-2]KCV24438.1 hypothetical protein L489_1771 [Bordetella bronchiseptica 00-P-2730]AMG88000.1 hypothetical protein AL472_09465 [Bordetella bronchiseptica]AWP84041.1 hypothetical protein B7P00_08025 [Bordetella bronchiseptica]AWQ09607.1 hypothetical protein B9G72_08015 [Bordetella bronchiseptica]